MFPKLWIRLNVQNRRAPPFYRKTFAFKVTVIIYIQVKAKRAWIGSLATALSRWNMKRVLIYSKDQGSMWRYRSESIDRHVILPSRLMLINPEEPSWIYIFFHVGLFNVFRFLSLVFPIKFFRATRVLFRPWRH